MKKKLIATVMATTMAVTALTGCGSSSSSSAKKDIKVPTEPFWLLTLFTMRPLSNTTLDMHQHFHLCFL